MTNRRSFGPSVKSTLPLREWFLIHCPPHPFPRQKFHESDCSLASQTRFWPVSTQLSQVSRIGLLIGQSEAFLASQHAAVTGFTNWIAHWPVRYVSGKSARSCQRFHESDCSLASQMRFWPVRTQLSEAHGTTAQADSLRSNCRVFDHCLFT